MRLTGCRNGARVLRIASDGAGSEGIEGWWLVHADGNDGGYEQGAEVGGGGVEGVAEGEALAVATEAEAHAPTIAAGETPPAVMREQGLTVKHRPITRRI